MTDAEHPTPGPQPETSLNEKITDPARIRSVIKGLRDNRSLLSARAEQVEGYFNTTLLKIDLEGGVLYLDELAPRQGHDQLTIGHTLHLYGVYNGVPTHLACVIDHIGEQNGIAFYRAPIPETMDYQQKRAHFRAYVAMGMEVLVHLRMEDGKRMSGRLQDLSLGGFGALLPHGSAVNALDTVTVEALQLPGHDPLTCTAEIRHTHPSQGQVHIGARFTDLSPRAERELLRMILELEREQIRKQTRS